MFEAPRSNRRDRRQQNTDREQLLIDEFSRVEGGEAPERVFVPDAKQIVSGVSPDEHPKNWAGGDSKKAQPQAAQPAGPSPLGPPRSEKQQSRDRQHEPGSDNLDKFGERLLDLYKSEKKEKEKEKAALEQSGTEKPTPTAELKRVERKANDEKRRDNMQEVMEQAFWDFEECLRRGASPTQWKAEQTPVRAFLEADATDVVGLLLRARADPTETDVKGVSLLHMAAFNGNLSTCKRLLDEKASPNEYDRYLQTPLFFAPTSAVCTLLYQRTADLTVVNKRGQSVIHLAARAGNVTVLRWFIKHVGREMLELRDHHGATATYYARAAGVTHGVINSLLSDEKATPTPSGLRPHYVNDGKFRDSRGRERKPSIIGYKVSKDEGSPARKTTSDRKSRIADRSSPSPSPQAKRRPQSAGPTRPPSRQASKKWSGNPEVFALSDGEGSPKLKSPYGWEAQTTPKSKKGPAPRAAEAGKAAEEAKAKAADLRRQAMQDQKELVKMKKSLTDERKHEVAKFEKEKHDLQRELEKMKAKVKASEHLKEQYQKSKGALDIVDELKKQNEALRSKSKIAEMESKRAKDRADKIVRTVQDNEFIREAAAVKLQSMFRQFKARQLAKKASRSQQKQREKRHRAMDNDQEGIPKSPRASLRSRESPAAGGSRSPQQTNQLTIKIPPEDATPRSATPSKGAGKSLAVRASTSRTGGPEARKTVTGSTTPKDKDERSYLRRGSGRSPTAAAVRGKKGQKVEPEQPEVPPETEEDRKDKEARIAAAKIQHRYRKSVVERKLSECPTEGAESFSKAMRTEQAVREFKKQQREKELRHRKRLQGTYRGSVAEKILFVEDTSFALNKLTRHYECVFMWESIVTRLFDCADCNRIGMMRSYMYMLDERGDAQKVDKLHDRIKQGDSLLDTTEEGQEELREKAMAAARLAREEKEKNIDPAVYVEAAKQKLDKEVKAYIRLRDEEETAATKIQARFRGKKANKETKLLKEEKEERKKTEKVQKEQKDKEALEENNAATKIQAKIRGQQSRKAAKPKEVAKGSKAKARDAEKPSSGAVPGPQPGVAKGSKTTAGDGEKPDTSATAGWDNFGSKNEDSVTSEDASVDDEDIDDVDDESF